MTEPLYKKLPNGAYLRTSDGAGIPPDPNNADYQAVLAWLAEGNVAPPAFEPSPAEVVAQLRSDLDAEYERRMAVIAADYPSSERESWPVQTQEALALLQDASAETPWIDAAAQARQIDRMELASRIIAKEMAYRTVHGALTGTRQRIEDQILAATDLTELTQIDVLTGWPEISGG